MLPILLFLFSPLASAQSVTHAPGATISEAASFQVTPAGLRTIEEIIPTQVDDTYPIPDQDGSVEVKDAWVGVDILDVRLLPGMGEMELQADLMVWINNELDPFYFNTPLGDCWPWIAPFPVNATMPATFEVVTDPDDGRRYAQAELGTIDFVHGLQSHHVDPQTKCWFMWAEVVLDAMDMSVIEFFVELAEPFIHDALEDQKADIEEQINDVLLSARYEDTLEVDQSEIEITIEPEEIHATPEGLEIVATSRIASEQGACMEARDPGGSLRTDTPVPPMSDLPGNTQFAVFLSDDAGNQGLYALWRTGLFCYELSEEDDLPLDLNTAILGIIGGEGFEALFPDPKPIRVMTAPDTPPRVKYDGVPDVVAELRELGVDFFTEVDHRQARALGVDLEADVPVEVDFDSTTGELLIDIELEVEDIWVIASHNPLVAGAEETIEEGFGGLLDVLMDQFLGDILDDLVFPIPSMDGYGLTHLSAGGAGGGDWLRVRAGLGPVSYDNTDLDEDEESGCGEGCATAGGAAGLVWVVLPLLWLRRRA